MSGIVGIFDLDGCAVKQTDLSQMLDTLAHRGTDAANVWCEGEVGFGHRMLWTTPESLLEVQPLVDSERNCILTADARIDNRDELITTLELAEQEPEKITDSDLILAAYHRWGKDCPQYLLGDFAFAIWDQSQQQLFCARDHLGVKPFYYYYQAEKAFLFASEMKALFCLPQIPQRINEVRIADFIMLMLEDKVITTYENVFRLPPAHSLIINQTELRTWSYWSLDPSKELHLESDQAYADAFREIFTEAVRCRLRSAFPIGSQLSGGLDSSSITCVARDLLAETKKPPLHTFSCVFDTLKQCDERSFIEAVLNQGEFIPHFIAGDQIGPLSDIDQIFEYEDEAFPGPNYYFPWRLTQIAKKQGVRILLDGHDGDNIVSHGIYRLTELASQGKWAVFAQETKTLAHNFGTSASTLVEIHGIPTLRKLAKQFGWLEFIEAIQQIHRHIGLSRKQLLVQHGLRPIVPDLIKKWVRRYQPFQVSGNKSTPLINQEFAERIGLQERLKHWSTPPYTPLTVRKNQFQALNAGVFTLVLEQIDRCAAAAGIEARHPFMDKRLIEFCLALPSEQKLRQGWSRMVMRRALRGSLPEVIQWRGGKGDLSDNFVHGLLEFNRAQLEGIMGTPLESINNYVNTNTVQKTYQKLISAKNLTSQEKMTIWLGASLTLALNKLSKNQKTV
ncbi:MULTISPECIES: lasso peptide isopeptide bond-forming cyclase [Moorena]|uniref:asparagine synthase (glutamine-hydrolyzing) n=2 Tax=Moorena TaxID=1155738 RepID=F4XY62_9CYAN|nr:MULTISPECIES: lasso peptide isopeptide bond-forming cyclase [Moorena]EGJ30459.1 glutamine-hydrolyzing asparagine synthase [Moorena producens 3L]NEP65883.1 lasso peptide isopeptide bond-forming cyclase [Moorena sp. SIO3A5]NER87371.1 lasso peptide isopeptide bond-forming cyclase [Moorena sp. SIO3A2]OLT68645.1 asparagine synthase (glutamine-hydrolyzing) [Moorena producens 3L]